MKKILFSPHPMFLSMIKKYFSDKEKYIIFPIQDGFTKSLRDIDVENVEGFVGSEKTQSDSYGYAAKTIKHYMKMPDRYKNNKIFQKFRKNLDNLAYRRLYELIIFLLVLDEKRPDVVVLHNDVEPFMRLIAMWAKENNVPCLHVPHSIIVDSSEKTKAGTDIHDIITSSDIIVGGNYQKNWYLQRGLQKDHIYQVGLPQFDKYAFVQLDKERAFRLLKLDPNKPVVTYASSWRQDTNLLGCNDGIEQNYINFLEASRILGIKPIVKLHPNSGKSTVDWHTMTAKKVGIYAILTLAHLNTVLQASDILFSFGPSNILIEGGFYPLHLMATHGFDNDEEITKVGKEATPEEIANAISKLLQTNPVESHRFREKYVGIVDGLAHQRIAEIIEGL